MFILIRAILFLCLLAGPVNAFTGKVVKVTDGDTLEVMHNGRAEKVRLAGIDCPENGQPYGQAARRFALELVAQKIVRIEVETTDRYGRTVGEVFLNNGTSLNRELVRNGHAWWYRRYSSETSLGQLEDAARQARRGLWQEPDPVAPWDWRRGKRQGALHNDQHGSSRIPSRTCGTKRFCKEMVDCQEARFFLQICGLTKLDGDGDGFPCEALCRR